jgi:superfamily II DNA or RNA helicase
VNGHIFLRQQMKKKFKMAHHLAATVGAQSVRRDYPNLYKYCFITEAKLEEWINKATYVRLFNSGSYTFPTGLLYLVAEYLSINGYQFEYIDSRVKPIKSYNFKKLVQLPTLRYYQEEILAQLEKHPRGIIEAATGSGKTLIIKHLIAMKGLRTLVVVPSSNILDIFDEQLTELFGTDNVGIITGGRKETFKPITVATYQSLPKIPPEWFKNIEMLITDEFHHSSADTLYELNTNQFKDIYFRYGFTATNYRNDSSDMSLKAIMSDVIYDYPFDKAIAEGYLAPINFVIYKYNNPYKQKTWRDENSYALVKNEEYNFKIKGIAEKLDANDISTLIFVNEIEHGETLQELIPNSMFITGKWSKKTNKDILERFNKKEFNVLIGTSVIGEGVDTVPAQVGIIASGFKADSEVVQKIGRLLRKHEAKKSSVLIDFTNSGTKYLNNHFEERLEIYKRYNGKIAYKDF